MRKLLWLILFFIGYVWLVTSGHDDFVLEKSKSLIRSFVTWFDGAEIDYNLKKDKDKEKLKKRSRRWD